MTALAPDSQPTAPHTALPRRRRAVSADDRIAIDSLQRPLPAESGDLVFVGHRPGGSLLVAVGDAMGCGPQAASLARRLEEHLTSLAASSAALGELLEFANELVFAQCRGERFMSLLLLELDPSNHSFRMANAGHPEPFAIGRARNVIPLGGNAPALGLVRDRDFREVGPLRLPAGVTLLITTDGVIEARALDGDPFGRRRVREVLRASAAGGTRGIVDALLDAADVHAAGKSDRSAVALRLS